MRLSVSDGRTSSKGSLLGSFCSRLCSFESEISEDAGQPFALEEVRGVTLQPRDADGDSLVYANFALNAGANRAWEFAARSEEEAREWVRAIDGILFKQSKKASRVVKC